MKNNERVDRLTKALDLIREVEFSFGYNHPARKLIDKDVSRNLLLMKNTLKDMDDEVEPESYFISWVRNYIREDDFQQTLDQHINYFISEAEAIDEGMDDPDRNFHVLNKDGYIIYTYSKGDWAE